MYSPTTEQMISHLEFLGYKVERTEKDLVAKHEKHTSLLLQEWGGGVVFIIGYWTNENARSYETEFLTWINDLNQRSFLLHFYADPEFRRFTGNVWYPSLYDKSNFGLFIDSLNTGVAILLFSDENVEKAKRFLI